MFYVIDFNNLTEEFEYVGAFSRKDEAEAFAGQYAPLGRFTPVVAEMSWKHVLDGAVSARLGALGEALKPMIERAVKVEATRSASNIHIFRAMGGDPRGLSRFFAGNADIVSGALRNAVQQGFQARNSTSPALDEPDPRGEALANALRAPARDPRFP